MQHMFLHLNYPIILFSQIIIGVQCSCMFQCFIGEKYLKDPIASPKHDQEKKEIKNKRKTEHRKKKKLTNNSDSLKLKT